jgi:citrate synthase
MSEKSFSKGLEGVIADETRIGLVDGEQGRLYYRGYAIEDLVARQSFDEVAYLLLFGSFPTAPELERFQKQLFEFQRLPASVLEVVEAMPAHLHPMEVLQSAVAVLGEIRPGALRVRRASGPDGTKRSVVEPRELLESDTLRVLAAIPSIVAARHRLEQKLPLLEPSPERSYLENFLFMFNGQAPTAEDVHVFGVCEMLQMEHGFNASTFTARTVASTLAPVHTSISSAIGALCGILHGGADEAAFVMARDDVGSPEAAAGYVAGVLAKGERIMGVGHREYKTLDPRASVLKGLADQLNASKGGEKERIFRTLVAVEAAVAAEMQKKGQKIYANVEFYKGSVFHALDIPSKYFTCMFAIARAFGWCAHVLELWQDHRIYRPSAAFIEQVGRPVPGRA